MWYIQSLCHPWSLIVMSDLWPDIGVALPEEMGGWVAHGLRFRLAKSDSPVSPISSFQISFYFQSKVDKFAKYLERLELG